MLLRLFAPTMLALMLGACAAASPDGSGVPHGPVPRAEHAWVMQGVGTWEGTLTSFDQGQPGEPMAAKEFVEAIGGFWTQSHFRCDEDGMNYRGTGCLGYDPGRGCFVGTWVDNTTDQIARMFGELDPSGRTLTLRWTARDPRSGAPTPFREELTFGPDSYTCTIREGHGGGRKVVEISMKRVAGGGF